MRPCPRPPSKKLLLEYVNIEVTRLGKTIGDTSKRCPNKLWLLYVLSTLKPSNLIFRKDYLPPPIKEKKYILENKLDNSDGFLTGLPKRTE